METSISNPPKTLITWRILHHNSTKITDQVQEGVSLKEEEDLRKFKIMIQEIHISIVDIMEGVIAPKIAQKPRRT
jgi:hypothetical protein